MRYELKMPPRERPPGDTDLSDLMEAFAERCDTLAVRLDDGLSVDEWRRIFEALLESGHKEAFGFGYRRSAGADPQEPLADELARTIRDLESYYLTGFENDLRDGKVTDPARRMAMYAGRMRGTANGGWVDGCDSEETFTWHLGAADHCEDCPVLAEGSPYSKDTIWTTPGGNETPCLMNCTCRLTRDSDGQSGFDLVNVWDTNEDE